MLGLFNEAMSITLSLYEGGDGLYTLLYCIRIVQYTSSSKALCSGLEVIHYHELMLYVFFVEELATLTALI